MRRQIENEFYKDNLSSVPVVFHGRKQSMKLRELGTVSDAWIVVLGDSGPQSSFDVVKFFQCFLKITDKIKELRDKLNVRVISTTDPLKLVAGTDPTTATKTANPFATKTALTTSNLAVTTTTTEPTTVTTTADSLATEMVLTTSNLPMTAEINGQESRACKKLQYDETNNEALEISTVYTAVQEKEKNENEEHSTSKSFLEKICFWKN